MTTIAYHHQSGTIAFDGRVTENDLIVNDDFNKLRWVDDEAWVFCGATCDHARFIEQHRSADPEKPKFSIDAGAIVATKSGVFKAGVTDEGEPFMVPLEVNTAIGSGSHFALAAMDHGRKAEGAVRYAMTRDCCSGGTVRVFDAREMKLL